jgi:hypothetical protein
MEIIQLLLNTFWLILMVIVFSILFYNGSINNLFKKSEFKNKKLNTEKEVY